MKIKVVLERPIPRSAQIAIVLTVLPVTIFSHAVGSCKETQREAGENSWRMIPSHFRWRIGKV